MTQRKIVYQLTVFASTPVAEDDETGVDYHTCDEAIAPSQQRAVERQIMLLLKRSDYECDVELVSYSVEEDI